MASLGHIKSLGLKVTAPIKMNYEMTPITQIMILVGPNGVGKTFVLKMNWLVMTIVNNSIVARLNNLPFDSAGVQFLIDNTITDHVLDGEIKAEFEHGTFVMYVEKGILKGHEVNVEPSVTPVNQPIFLSSDTRLFTDIIRYMKFKKGMNLDFRTEEGLKKLCTMYRIYDILFIEGLLVHLSLITPEKLAEVNKFLQGFDLEFNYQSINVSETMADVFYTDDKHENRSLSQLGAGHQALTTTALATLLMG